MAAGLDLLESARILRERAPREGLDINFVCPCLAFGSRIGLVLRKLCWYLLSLGKH